MNSLPFGMSDSQNQNVTTASTLPFGTSRNGSSVPSDLPFGMGKDPVDIDRALSHLPQARTFPMPKLPDRFEPEFGRWQHYRLPDVNGQKPTAYYPRVTTIGKSLEDTEFLDKWKTGKLLEGVARHREILDLIDVDAAANGDRIQRDLMDKLAERARETVGGADAGKFGDAVHAWTEAIDLGVYTINDVPAELKGHVAAYLNACRAAGITAVPKFIECIIYNPYTGAAGRIDRISRLADGTLVIVDVKTTNNLNSGVLGISVQLAQYATATHILAADGQSWNPMPDVSQELAIVAHVPSTPDPEIGVVCDLVDIDLTAGIDNMMKAVGVRESRSKKRFLATGTRLRAYPEGGIPPVPVTDREPTHIETVVWEAIHNARCEEDMVTLFAQGTEAGIWEDRFTTWGMHRLHTIGITVPSVYHTL